MPITITIDGPAGSGKGTTARKLAERLWYRFLDSGAMYRALWIFLREKGINIEYVEASDLEGIVINFSAENRVLINGEDYEWKIRTVEASTLASLLSSQKLPRELVISAGRKIIEHDNYVLEWRDTGSIWVPHADVKIYLIADAKVRAHRRWLELQQKGEDIAEEEVLKKICERDNRDMVRSDGPLSKPHDAHEVDTTHMTIDEQVEVIYWFVQEVLQKPENLS